MANAVFPTSVKTWTDVVDNVDNVLALHINEAYAEIIAVENYLNRFSVDANGKVGYGTSTLTYQMNINGGTDNIIAEFISTDAQALAKFTDDTGTSYCGTVGNNFVVFPAGTEKLRVNATGLGVHTDSPATIVDIHKNVNTGTTSMLQFSKRNSTSTKVSYVGIDIGISNNIAGQEDGTFAIKTMLDGSLVERFNLSGAKTITMNPDGTGNKFYMDVSGNVCLGDTTPSYKLDLNENWDGTVTLQIRNRNATVSENRMTRFLMGGNSGANSFIIECGKNNSNSDVAYLGTTTNHDLSIVRNNSTITTFTSAGQTLLGSLILQGGSTQNTISGLSSGDIEFIANSNTQNVTPEFIWKSSVSSGSVLERMRLTSDAKLGIMTNSPLGRADFSDGAIALVIGADSTLTTRTNITNKYGRMGIPHYTNAEEPVALIYGQSTSTLNTVLIGGGTSYFNSANHIKFYTGATTTTVTGTERMKIDSAGSIYMGNSTDYVKVDLTGSNALIQLVDNNQTNPPAIRGDGPYFQILNGGDVALSVNASRNVGIGVINATALLQLSTSVVKHQIRSYGSGNVAYRTYSSSDGAGLIINAYQSEGSPSYMKTVDIVSGADAGADSIIRLFTFLNGTSSEVVRVNENGFVGMGNTNPTERLVANGAIRSTGQSNNFSTGGASVFMDIVTSTKIARIGTVTGGDSLTGTEGDVQLMVKGSAIATLNSTGLGIGITPISKLHVQSEEIGTGVNKGINISNHNDTKRYSIRTGITGLNNTSLSIYDETVGIDRFIVDTSGNFGIGITNPQAQLDVYKSYPNTSFISAKISALNSHTTTGSRSVNGLYIVQTPTVYASQSNTGSGRGLIIDGYINSTLHQGTLSSLEGAVVNTGIISCGASGTVTNVYGFKGVIYNNDVDGTISNAYGLRIDYSGTAGTINQKWGLYVDGDKNYFESHLGLGTTDIEAWQGFKAIQIGANSSIAADGNTITMAENCYYDGSWKYRTTDYTTMYYQNGGEHVFRIAGSGTIDTAITWTTALIIKNSGKIGIGDTPVHYVHIANGNSTGTYGLAVIGDTGASRDIFLAGQAGYSNGFTVQYNGSEMLYNFLNGKVVIGATTATALLDVNSDTLRLRSSRTPTSASAGGNAGEICWDSTYIYVCISTNSWVRATLNSW